MKWCDLQTGNCEVKKPVILRLDLRQGHLDRMGLCAIVTLYLFPFMNPSEQKLLEELERSLDGSLQKKVMQSYIVTGTVEGILKPLLESLSEELARNETA